VKSKKERYIDFVIDVLVNKSKLVVDLNTIRIKYPHVDYYILFNESVFVNIDVRMIKNTKPRMFYYYLMVYCEKYFSLTIEELDRVWVEYGGRMVEERNKLVLELNNNWLC
jgi:hypothetical protein